MTQPHDAQQTESQHGWFWPILKWSLFAAVVVFIGRRAWQLWNTEELGQVQLNGFWLVLAGLVYALGWLPSVWFWRRLLASFGHGLPFGPTARAYYCGHLGKYIPGKAMVLVIRAGMMRRWGVRLSTGALTATYETLLLMGVALAVAVALSPLFLTDAHWQRLPAQLAWMQKSPYVVPCLVLAVVVAVMPIVSRLLSFLSRKATPRDFTESDTARVVLVPTKLLYEGCLAFLLAWFCHGLSLGCTVQAISADGFRIETWPVWTAAVSLATSVGFLALFAPGGLGVREGLLIETLRPVVGGPIAILAAVLLRAVWFVTEIVVAAGLYYLWRQDAPGTSDQKEPQS